jgi:hypothetical protein
MRCPFALAIPWLYDHGGGGGLISIFRGGLWNSVSKIICV